MPCGWAGWLLAQDEVPVRLGDCVMQQRPASQQVVLWESVKHGVYSVSSLGLFLSTQPDHAGTHSSGTAVYAPGRRCLHPSSLHDGRHLLLIQVHSRSKLATSLWMMLEKALQSTETSCSGTL